MKKFWETHCICWAKPTKLRQWKKHGVAYRSWQFHKNWARDALLWTIIFSKFITFEVSGIPYLHPFADEDEIWRGRIRIHLILPSIRALWPSTVVDRDRTCANAGDSLKNRALLDARTSSTEYAHRRPPTLADTFTVTVAYGYRLNSTLW